MTGLQSGAMTLLMNDAQFNGDYVVPSQNLACTFEMKGLSAQGKSLRSDMAKASGKVTYDPRRATFTNILLSNTKISGLEGTTGSSTSTLLPEVRLDGAYVLVSKDLNYTVNVPMTSSDKPFTLKSNGDIRLLTTPAALPVTGRVRVSVDRFANCLQTFHNLKFADSLEKKAGALPIPDLVSSIAQIPADVVSNIPFVGDLFKKVQKQVSKQVNNVVQKISNIPVTLDFDLRREGAYVSGIKVYP